VRKARCAPRREHAAIAVRQSEKSPRKKVVIEEHKIRGSAVAGLLDRPEPLRRSGE